MHQVFSSTAFEIYNRARATFLSDPESIIRLEEELTKKLATLITSDLDEIVRDYNSASTLYPFWQNYPPESRGRAPIGDQYPWIEVGEHAVGRKITHLLRRTCEVEDLGFPCGADERPLIRLVGETAERISAVWLNLDIKSVGPRDDQDHAVMSHNQISGSGEWDTPSKGVSNEPMTATGARSSHPFYPALPPLLILPDGTVALTVTMALKPVYSMLPEIEGQWSGQPMDRLDLVTIPNGLLLTQNPNYLTQNPGLLFPGKDEKKKDARKMRARVSFDLLRQISPWRYQNIWGSS